MLTYKIDLLSIKVFGKEGCPCEDFTAFVFWNLVKLCANQQQRYRVLSKLLSVIVPEEREERDLIFLLSE